MAINVTFKDTVTKAPIDTGDAANKAARVNVVASIAAGGGGTSSSFGAVFPATGTAAGAKDSLGNMAGFNLDAAGNLKIVESALVPAQTNVATNITITAAVVTFPNVTVPLGARYVQASLFVTGVVSGTTPTLDVIISVQEPQSGNFIPWLVSTNLTATNTGTAILVGPDVPVIANTSSPGVLGSIIQIQTNAGGANRSFAGVFITLTWSS